MGMQQMSVVVSGMEMQHATVSTPFFRVGKMKLRNGNLLLSLETLDHASLTLNGPCALPCLPANPLWGAPTKPACPKTHCTKNLTVTQTALSCCNNNPTAGRLLSSTHLAQLHLLAHSRQPCVQDGVQDARNREHTTHHRTCRRQELVPRLGQLPHHHL